MVKYTLWVRNNGRNIIIRNLDNKLYNKYCKMLEKTGHFRLRIYHHATKYFDGFSQYVDINEGKNLSKGD